MAITLSIHGPRPKFLVPSSSTPPRLSETALTFGHTMSLGGAMGCLRKGVILLWMRFHVKRSGQKTLELGFRRGIGWAIDPQVPALFAQSHGFFFSIPPNSTIFHLLRQPHVRPQVMRGHLCPHDLVASLYLLQSLFLSIY